MAGVAQASPRREAARGAIIGMLFAVLLCREATAGDLALPYTLTKPTGNGPFPAVVILHDCSGLGPKSSGAPYRWWTRLNAKGYVTIAPDSFATRGHPDGVCTDGSEPIVTYRQRADDAYAALAHLRTLPFVDGGRIALMGGSHGGTSALVSNVDGIVNGARQTGGFAAAIAFYPGCGGPLGEWSSVREREAGSPITGYRGVYKPLAPLLILTGELDDWTPAEPCRQMAERARAAGQPVDITVYPGAHHAFDSRTPKVFNEKRRNGNAKGGLGATTEGNAAAWADAADKVVAFLAKHLAEKVK